jgi:hypothetical protein
LGWEEDKLGVHDAPLRFRSRWLILASLVTLPGLILSAGPPESFAGAGVSKAGAAKERGWVAGVAKRRAGLHCGSKRRRASGSRRRACRRANRGRGEARRRRAAARRRATARREVASAERPQPSGAFSPGQTASAEDPPIVVPRCELVEGDCYIYSDAFWLLLARYERFEAATGVYPMPPECMEAVAEERADVCPQVITYLYPDGTLGSAPWVVDPCAPGGWRLWESGAPVCDASRVG